MTMPFADMNDAVCQFFASVVSAVSPNEIYVAIDGVAPFAKMDQQRDRRFKSAKESKIKKDIAIKHGQPTRTDNIDFNMISPGTEFMYNLQLHLENYIETRRQQDWSGINVILSGSGVPGEGEHKIMHEIRRRNAIKGYSEVSCVCGLDADLMFLSLLNAPNAILVRENVFFQGRDKLDLNPETYPYVYLDIAALRSIMLETLRPSTTLEMLKSLDFTNTIGEFDGHYNMSHYNGSAKHDARLIVDYAYICFFLGNDFLPRLPCLKIKSGSLNDIIVLYKRVSWNLCGYMINEDYTVNMSFLHEFLEEIAYIENELLLLLSEQRIKDISRFKFRLQNKSEYEKELEEFNYIENKYSDTIQMGKPGWRIRYYNYHLKWVYRHDSEFERNLQPLCEEYLQGTVWVLQYYLGLHDNWTWIYPYSIAPSAQDLCHALRPNREGSYMIDLDITFGKDIPVTSYVQLLSILPPDSAELLPPVLRPLMTDKDSPIHYLYPLKITLALVGNKFWHECKAWLPHVDQEQLCRVVEAKMKYLTPLEQSRNTCQEIKIYK
jgi:5'-3' exoribonuclease 2